MPGNINFLYATQYELCFWESKGSFSSPTARRAEGLLHLDCVCDVCVVYFLQIEPCDSFGRRYSDIFSSWYEICIPFSLLLFIRYLKYIGIQIYIYTVCIKNETGFLLNSSCHKAAKYMLTYFFYLNLYTYVNFE